MASHEHEKEVQEVKKGLISFIDELSSTLQKAPEKISELNNRFAQIHSSILRLAMTSFTKADKVFLNNAVEMLENQIKPILEQNKDLKASQTQALRSLQQAKADLQAPSTTPRMGK